MKFLDALGQLAGGAAEKELDVSMRELLAQVRKTGQSGKLSFSMTVRPSGEGQVEIDYQVSSKTPEPRRKETIFWVDGEDNLTRTAPAQMEMDLVPRPISGIE